jgi:DNA-binding transcriptional ArsR family regulator
VLSDKAASVCASLADGNRITLLNIMLTVDREVFTVKDLSELSGLDKRQVRRHIDSLTQGGLVEKKHKGNRILCTVKAHEVHTFLVYLRHSLSQQHLQGRLSLQTGDEPPSLNRDRLAEYEQRPSSLAHRLSELSLRHKIERDRYQSLRNKIKRMSSP